MKQYFNNLGFEINGIFNLTGRQALECITSGALLVDVREDFEIAMRDFGVTGKQFIPFTDFDNLCRSLPRDRSLIIADCVGIHSKEAARILINNGYTRVANLAGGICDWEKDGLPMKTSIESMSGQCPCTMRSRKQ